MRNLIWAAPAIFFGMQLCASADTVAPGTQIQVRTDQPIEMHTWDRGRIFHGVIARDVEARDGDVAIRRGSPVELIVRQTGPDQLVLDMESVTVNGKRYALDTSGPNFNGDQYRNGGGLLGNIVGAVTGGQVQVVTRGNEIRVPQGAMITFQLEAPLHVVDWRDPGYDRDQNHYHRDNDWYR
jgi:hypothetical protein